MDRWPLCDCFVAFHSRGFPLEKAIEYTRLRRPFIINNLEMQFDIQVGGSQAGYCSNLTFRP